MHSRFTVVLLLAIGALTGRGIAEPSPKNWIVETGSSWIPFTPSRDVEAGSALDFSRQGALDAPAGKYGWLKAVGPHFEFEKRPGVNQRFYGANLCLEANYPRTEAEADRLVARLVRAGYNTVRLHHHDGKLYRLDKNLRPVLNEPAVAQLDRFLSKAFAAGLYVTTDLYVSRKVSWREIGVDRDGSDGLGFKAMLFVHDGALQNWKDAAKALFTHRNPYTGRTYAEEPALAFVCLVNENSIQQAIKDGAKNPYLREAWKTWLTAERAKTPGCWPSLTPEEIPTNGGGWSPSPVLKGEAWDAVARFCAELETRMYTRMRDYLRNELGVKALLTDENWGTQPAPMQAVRASLFDYVDAHHYVDHPEFPEGGWHLPSTLYNENILGRDGCSMEISWRRVANKPFAVSEWNFCGPARHRSMSGLYMGTLAALQDWNVLWRFAYSHWFTAYDDNFGSVGYFDAVNDPAALMAERLFVPLFLRGDLKPLETAVATELTPDSVTPPSRDRAYNVLPRWANRQWDCRVATVLPGQAPAGTVTVPMDKAAVDENPPVTPRPSPCVTTDRTRKTMSVATDLTCALYATKGDFSAGALSVKNEGGEATVWVTSLDGRPVATSGRLLVVRLGDVQSVGTEFADASCRKVLKWGKGMCMEAGRSEISIRRECPCAVWSLDMAGRRRSRVATTFTDGALRFVADVAADREGASFAYELCETNRAFTASVGDTGRKFGEIAPQLLTHVGGDAINNDDIPPPAKGGGALIKVFPSRVLGEVKPMNAVNNGPNFVYDGTGWHDGRFDEYRALEIPMARTHDSRFMEGPGTRLNDLALVFPNFAADESDPKNYDFDLTDLNLHTIRLAGAEIMYCLGSSCDSLFKCYGTDEPPKDLAKWARIAANIVRHYNEGWGWSNKRIAFSNQFNVVYWELWNEPDIDVAKEYWEKGTRTWERRHRYWNGSPEQFFDFYTVAAKHLKMTFPRLKFGGPGLAGRADWAERFLAHCAKNGAPIDFFTWHSYPSGLSGVAHRAQANREMLDRHGYAKTESILGEWNWNLGWYGDAIRMSIARRGEMNNYRVAAFYAALMCTMQHAPVDRLMYYDMRVPCQYNGVFSNDAELPLKGYYAFYAWSRLRRLGQEVSSSVEGECADDIRSVAARGRDGGLAVCVARYTPDSDVLASVSVRLAVNGRRLDAARLHMTDELERYTEKALRVRPDGTADFRLPPNAFAVIELGP